MADRPHHARTSVAASVVALVLLAGCSSGPSAAERRAEAAAAASAAATPTPTPTVAAPVDLAAFAAIDRAGWDAIVADPAAAAGQQVIVYGVVQQFFTSAGPGVLQARITTKQPADPSEGTAAVVRADAAALADVEVGDVVQLYVDVTGPFGGTSGASTSTPELHAASVQEVGLRDLTADVVMGPATVAGGGVNVPITVTNSADVTMNYAVEVMAASADGARNYGTVTAHATFLAPGQAGASVARFSGALPAGVAFTLVSIRRTPTPTP